MMQEDHSKLAMRQPNNTSKHAFDGRERHSLLDFKILKLYEMIVRLVKQKIHAYV
jgi:hypothetical protein